MRAKTRGKTRLLAAGCVALIAALALPGAAGATTQTFTSNTAIAIPDGGAAPASSIVVSGLPGLTDDVNVTLDNLTHKRPSDVRASLTAPNGGATAVLLDGSGAATEVVDTDLAFAQPSAFDGFNPNGSWTLQLSDADASPVGADPSTGDIEGWALTVSTNSNGKPPTSNPHAGPKPKKAHKPKKCKPKHGRGHGRGQFKPKKCKPKHRGLHRGHHHR